MSIFNKDFYPTPIEVLDIMGFDPKGKTILEPSAGSGNIIDYCKNLCASRVVACEKSEQLATIAKSKCDQWLGNDFLELTNEDVSHIDMIVANPPFSEGVKHVLHMWEIAPDGCEIYSLINHDNFSTRFGPTMRLRSIINEFGLLENLGNVFSDSERKTNVQVGLIKLFKPASTKSGFEGFFMDDEHEVNTEHGLIQPNAVRDLVERYVDAVKKFEEFQILQNEMNSILAPTGVKPLTVSINRKDFNIDRDTFVSELQKVFWKHVFNKMDLDRFFTKQVREKINKFAEQQEKIPFTMKNIYRMVEIIHGTKDNILKEALVEAVDNFTKHSHENRFMVEGWKTNSGYMLNEKFIMGYVRDNMYNYPHIRWGCSSGARLDDLVRVLCNLTGVNYSLSNDLYHFFSRNYETYIDENGEEKYKLNDLGRKIDVYKEFGVWYEWTFFEIKMFKKGTLHVKFKDREVWALLNKKYAEIKGQVLPEKI